MDKKERIIVAAIEQFTLKGVEGTKISDIVKAAGIAQGTFYLYFPTKFSVMPEIAKYAVHQIMDEIQATVDETAKFEVRLAQFIQAVFAINERERQLFAILYAGISQSEHLKQWESIYAPFYEWVCSLLQKAKDKGEIRSTINCERTSRIIIGTIESTAEQLFLFDTSTKEEVEAQFNELVLFTKSALS